MSNFPPPGAPIGGPVGGPPGPPPPPTWQTQIQPGGQPPAPKSNTGKIITAFVVVAALAAGGVYLATKKDDSKSITKSTEVTDTVDTTDTTEVDTTDVTVPATEATEAPTTAAPTTEAPTTTAAPPVSMSPPNITFPPLSAPPTTAAGTPTSDAGTVPANAIDLGNQVSLPLPDGWTDTPGTLGLHTLANADQSLKLVIQVLARTPGEDPSVLMQSYADTFTTEFSAVSFSSTVRNSISGGLPAYRYGTYYEGYDATKDGGLGVTGGLYVFQRADGLSMIYDTFGPSASMAIPDADFNVLLNSYITAPQIATPVDLQAVTSFRPTAPTASLPISGLLGFTIVPNFTDTSPGNGSAQASASDEIFSADYQTAQASVDAAIATAQATLGSAVSGLTFTTVSTSDPYGTLSHDYVSWNGTSNADSSALTGGIDVYWDPDTMNAVAITRAWAQSEATEPEANATAFMYTSMTDDIAYGIP
ncbi:MAG: hypothetical protein JWM34_1881 [Ilumatobacteraceae bacterium]|nr:hypothetical protein [Ilumatobacteraceae bacterium]